MKYLSIRKDAHLILFFIILFKFSSNSLFANNIDIKIPYRIAKGDSGFSTLNKHNAILYNPASNWKLSPDCNDIYSCYGDNTQVFTQVELNSVSKSLIQQYKKLKNLKGVDSINQIEELVGKNIFIGFAGGISYILNSYISFGFFNNINYQSVIRGTSLPIVDLELNYKAEFIASISYPILENLLIGLNIKPMYLFHFALHSDIMNILSDHTLLNPTKNGTEGTTISTDLGLMWKFNLNSHRISVGTLLKNIGSPKLKKIHKITSENDISPVKLETEYFYSANYAYPILNGSFIELSYTYHQDPNNYYDLPPHRLGLSLNYRDYIKFAIGKYKGENTLGFAINILNIELQLATYNEPIGLNDKTINKRYLLQSNVSF